MTLDEMFGKISHWVRDLFEEDGCTFVTVESGDTLSGIAHKWTGDGDRWRELEAANPEKGWNDQHTMIHPGEKIKLPDVWVKEGPKS
jgi:nucleoid-associated protein YgaU